MIPITVFTPTYNRARLLERCYESLKKQTVKEFIWMVIDDGSTDNTDIIVKKWIESEKDFAIEYYYKENGGLHTAYNEAIAHIETLLCVCIDSDDWMPEDAIEKILSFWKTNGSKKVAGIVGLDCYPDGKVIGDLLPQQKTVNLIDLQVGKYKIHNGDRTNVVRTELYKSVAPMKVFPGEKNFNPHYMHLLISKNYDFLVYNEPLRYVEYQQGGMSNSILRQYKNSPNSFAEIRRLYLSFPDTGFNYRLRNTAHLVSSCLLCGDISKAFKYGCSNWITMIAFPIGIVMTIYIAIMG